MQDQSQQSFSLNWKIAGKAGEGVMATAKILARICKRHGLNAFNYYEYPSLIKGGHQTGQVYASTDNASCQKRELDLLITLGPNGLTEHQEEITNKTLILYNSDSPKNSQLTANSSQLLEIPFYTISREATGHLIAMNMVTLGASAYFLGLDVEIAKQEIQDEFGSKGQEVVNQDIAAFEAGFAKAKELGQPLFTIPKSEDKQIILTGNEAVGLGALAAGIQFYSAYPMTPASGLLHYLASKQEDFPLVVKHAEDEIAAINNALGASFAGVRAMTGSSGGGFALMTEAVSFASIAEIPLVILEAQRKGPATGLPTWTEQADLEFVLHSGHGDLQRVVFTPGTVAEHFELTKVAFYLAEKYQIPVFILSDKFVLESHQTMPEPDLNQTNQRYSMVTQVKEGEEYHRYKLTESGISERSIPGVENGLQLTNSYEHDEFGFATEEADMTQAQCDKRAKKMNQLIQELPQPYVVGPAEADITFVCWGSTINVLKQLVFQLPIINSQLSINVIHIPTIHPFPVETFTTLANKAKKLVMVEGNQSGQTEKLIRRETGITMHDHIRRYDGRPFYVEDLLKYLSNNDQ